MQALFTVDPGESLSELADESVLFASLGERLPAELVHERALAQLRVGRLQGPWAPR